MNDCIDTLVKHIEQNQQTTVNEVKQQQQQNLDHQQQSNETIRQIKHLQICSNDQVSEQQNFDNEHNLTMESDENQQQSKVNHRLSPAALPFVPQGAVKKINNKFIFDKNYSLNNPSATMSFSSFLKDDTEFVDQHVPDTKHARLSSPDLPAEYAEILDDIRRGLKILILMRGMPGSGKSHLAKQVINETMDSDYQNHIFSTDDFFYNRQNQYQYNRHKISNAHDFNQARVRQRAIDGWSPIIVDNTNSELWEMFIYVQFAVENGYLIRILEPKTTWSKSAGRLAMRNIHNVPKDKIEQMLQRYTPTSVNLLLQSINIRYECQMPQLRQNPPPPSVSWQCSIGDCSGVTGIETKDSNQANVVLGEQVWSDDWTDNTDKLTNKKTLTNEVALNSKNERITIDPIQTQTPKVDEVVEKTEINSIKVQDIAKELTSPETMGYTFDIAKRKIELLNNEWRAFEKERCEFWGNTSYTSQKSKPTIIAPKNSADVSTESQILSILKDNVLHPKTDNDNKSESNKKQLSYHKKDCPNENRSFAQIRQIYPTVPIEILWDLFQHCDGDPDWTMDILLKEEARIDEFQNSKTQGDFQCQCSYSILPLIADLTNDTTLVATTSSGTVNKEQRTARRVERLPHNKEESLNVKKIIENNCIIPDQYYSDHVRKIRNIRHGMQPQQHMMTVTGMGYVQDNAEYLNETNITPSAIDNDVNVDTCNGNDLNSQIDENSDELLEINLGAELICQLDSAFGIDAYQNDFVRNLKTNVFMPKELAHQLYALWIESLFNQIEEQRHQSIKEDKEFARSLETQQNFPNSLSNSNEKCTFDEKNLLEMECAWAAYKGNIEHGWKLSTKHDLAAHLTRAKLCELFPNIDSNTLHEMLEAYGNNFDLTVEVLKKNLNQSENKNIERDSQYLIDQAKAEIEAMPKTTLNTLNNTDQRTLEIKKLGPEEAKRAALADFEECRNMAAHHTQLKAECYRKAQEVIQRGDTGTAMYYSQIANLHKNKIDMFNHKASNAIMEVHNFTQNNPDMLDLHYLHVIEAIQCLDIFLDKHITKVKAMRQAYKYVFVITGRGLHSSGGIAAIKQRVKIRLKERGLTWSEVNPGLLKVRIQANSKFCT